MKAFLDFEEKSVEKAIQKACGELNIPKDKLKYDIISYGSSGIFGLVGTKKALIRVFIPEQLRNKQKLNASETNLKISGKATSTESSHRETVTALVDEAFGEIEETRTPVAEEIKEPDQAVPIETEIQLRVAKEFLEKIIDLLSLDVTVNFGKDHKAGIHVRGKDSGFLIGKKGQTLESIQYLVDKVVNKQGGKKQQITIDVEGYIESRKAELKDLAKRLAEKAKRTGKPSTISRMNAQERRVVHLALKNNKSVRTQSIGDGYYRKLIIFPKKKSYRKKSKDMPAAK